MPGLIELVLAVRVVQAPLRFEWFAVFRVRGRVREVCVLFESELRSAIGPGARVVLGEVAHSARDAGLHRRFMSNPLVVLESVLAHLINVRLFCELKVNSE